MPWSSCCSGRSVTGIGKARIIVACLVVLTLATATAALAPSLEILFAARVLGGLAGGGIIPLAIALVGDHVPFAGRQTALSKIMTALVGAVLVGTAGTGFLATLVGWRGVFAAAAVLSAIVSCIAIAALRDKPAAGPAAGGRGATTRRTGNLLQGYARTFAHPLAYVCFGAVLIEGVLVLGLLPYVATLLGARGAGGVAQAGIVLAGLAIGGLVYTQSAARLIARLGGVVNLIRCGAVFITLGFFGIALQASWQVEMAAFMLLGFGFYSIHNSLQTQATELAPDNRGAAVALFAFFFFVGQSAGPLFYAVALHVVSPAPLLAAIGIIAGALALQLAAALKPSHGG